MFRFTSVVVSATLSIVGLASASAGASSAPVTTPSSCLLDAATVSEVSGTEIAEVTMSGGAVASTSAGDISLLAAPDLSWTGCGYETSDASELDVSELVAIEGGAHPGEQFDQVAAVAAANENLAASIGHAGAEEFLSADSELFVTDGNETMRLHVGDISGVEGAVALDAIAGGLLVLGPTDVATRCDALARLVPRTWGKTDAVTAGGGTENGFTFTSCAVALPDLGGLTLQLDVADGREWYDAMFEQQRPLTPVHIAGLGDDAYWYGRINGVLVRVDDQVLVVTGEDADGNALDQKMLENLAAEAVSAFTPVRTGD